MVKPFLKWAGSKRQLQNDILARVPPHFKRYHEPMLGGGAVFFALEAAGRITEAVLSDLNPDLIEVFEAVRDDTDELIECLEHQYAFDPGPRPGPRPNSSDFYYNTRKISPEDLKKVSRATRAARFIYLNKTCFNGLYRVNKKGEFNVPFGDYKNPKILDKANLLDASRALKKASLLTGGYYQVVDRLNKDDFVYFDPPYIPLTGTSDFTNFTAEGFDMVDHYVLADIIDQCATKGAYVMLSNSDTLLSRQIFSKLNIETVQARRSINSKGKKRGHVNEIIARSY